MDDPTAPPPLRLAPTPPAPTQRRAQTEPAAPSASPQTPEGSLAPFRVGSVPYLNTVPLTCGLEQQLVFATPARLAELLRRDELDAALVSVTEVLFTNRYDVLDGIAIASLGEVQSVLLAHRPPLAELSEVHCDTASLTSVNLLRVLLAERGLHPTFTPLPNYAQASACDAVLLIGDPALDFLRAPLTHTIWDLGTAWFEGTQLPFVYAVWALRRDVPNEPLRRRLRQARDLGLDTLDHIIRTRTEYDRDFRQDYLRWHIHYHLGTDEKRGLARFAALLAKHGSAPVYAPVFVE
ncbi:MAG: menaquinone biosynthesis protein [Verrucomicrobia bacterium]|nr:menaquinone biosynthesis protein [Verrucomicrobiota bacterium]